MNIAAIDYRTKLGLARRSLGESTLAKYIRVAAGEFGDQARRCPLPLARPQINCRLSSQEYFFLLDILDELFILEQAARFADRKSSSIARSRLLKAVAVEIGVKPESVEGLFHAVDFSNADLIARIAAVLFPELPDCPPPQVARTPLTEGSILSFYGQK